jgi:ABC-type uncharacterized transport system ATPase subunit
MDIIRRWKRRVQRFVDAHQPRDAKIYVESIQFSGGQEVTLNESSILVIVGPNNAGKSSVLREIRDRLQERYRFGPVLKNAEIRVIGSVAAFQKQILEAGIATGKLGVIRVGDYEYSITNIEEEHKRGFTGSKAIPLFVSYLGAEERLDITDPGRRGDYLRSAPKTPMQWLELDDGAEKRISDIFERTFDAALVLNTLAGDNLMLHVVQPGDIKTEFSNAREQATWLASLPRLHRQGDGMRSFAGTLMSLLVHPTSAILLDEPEAFLHPPQARRLAEIIATEVPGGCQVILATHNDAFVRALLDVSGDRVTLARIVRDGSVNRATILNQSQLREIWNDSLLRTSDVLSALFHEAAVLCEGDSDARFYTAVMEATRSESRDPDVRLYHFGGKDRLGSMARALRAVQIPVVVIVDIDILSDKEKFFALFDSLGGKVSAVEKDVVDINRLVMQRKGQLTGSELAIELRRLATEADGANDVSKETRNKLLELGRISSNWQRVKQDGIRALDAQIFYRISEACKAVGLLINPEGELEGFCRLLSSSRKNEWLAEVIRKDLAQDESLRDAREFAEEIRRVIRQVVSPRNISPSLASADKTD